MCQEYRRVTSSTEGLKEVSSGAQALVCCSRACEGNVSTFSNFSVKLEVCFARYTARQMLRRHSLQQRESLIHKAAKRGDGRHSQICLPRVEGLGVFIR